VDLVYKPLKTSVLARAEARGLKIVDGLGMLLHQGAIAFEMWTGSPPPIDVMREALRS
jgi:shikimate dehydrogenase